MPEPPQDPLSACAVRNARKQPAFQYGGALDGLGLPVEAGVSLTARVGP